MSTSANEDKGAAVSKDPAAIKATEPDMAQIHSMLSKIIEETADLKEIRRSLSSLDTKLFIYYSTTPSSLSLRRWKKERVS